MPARKTKTKTQTDEEYVEVTPQNVKELLCECKRIKGPKLYAMYNSWIPGNQRDWSDLTPEQKLAWIMMSNGKSKN